MKNMMLLLSFITLNSPAFADERLDSEILRIQHAWDKARYQTSGNAQESAFKTLTEETHQLTVSNPNAAEPLIWEALSNIGYAYAKEGMGALKFVQKARDLLLAAEKINPLALQGTVYANLGMLYYQLRGWPVSAGGRKTAKQYLEKALEVNPAGIDPNYFYAGFLDEQGNHVKAIEYYKKALAAPPRPDREDADAGRKKEIELALKTRGGNKVDSFDGLRP